MSDLMSEVTDVFRAVFHDEDLVVDRETTATDVPGWDSLSHVTLILTMEQRFAIRFASTEVAMLKNVGELEDMIISRQSRR